MSNLSYLNLSFDVFIIFMLESFHGGVSGNMIFSPCLQSCAAVVMVSATSFHHRALALQPQGLANLFYRTEYLNIIE
jgi:hypothetical protein